MKSTYPSDAMASFSRRLKEALQLRGKSVSPTSVEREFNLRYPGKPVTSHAVRKWLLGQSMPTQDKLQVLAKWLDVNEEWLRWGQPLRTTDPYRPPGEPLHAVVHNHAAQEDASLLQDWRLLEPPHRRAVRAVIETLLRHQRESSASQP